MDRNAPISFGDTVRVRSVPLTEELGLAHLVGKVFGFTTPSVTGVEVIGSIEGDSAVNVFFDARKVGFWFAPNLLEFVDHGQGAEIRLRGVPKKWVRASTGEWVESDLSGGSTPDSKPWWKFW